MSRSIARVLAVAAVTLTALGLAAPPASAHVSVQPETAVQGGFGAFSFRVPTERSDAGTTKLEVHFPIDQPLVSVSVKPHPGWTYKVEKTKLQSAAQIEGSQVTETVSKIIWTADSKGAAIAPGEYDEFWVSAGPLPKADQMVFKAIQTYEGGEIVRWIEESAPGVAEESEHPAPTLKLRPAGQEQEQVAAAPAAAQGDQAGGASGEDSEALPIALAAIALMVGLASGLLAGLALRRTRSAAPASE